MQNVASILSGREIGTFSSPPPPHTFQYDVFAINYISIAFPMKQFSFNVILKVILKDSDTNFVHTLSLSTYAFLMKKSTASCFESSINTQYEHDYSQIV